MKIGDLVKCPESMPLSSELGYCATEPGYVGVIVGVCGYKITVLGGSVVSWDGIKGKRSWDKADISLVRQ
jgi:hypothetical protein